MKKNTVVITGADVTRTFGRHDSQATRELDVFLEGIVDPRVTLIDREIGQLQTLTARLKGLNRSK